MIREVEELRAVAASAMKQGRLRLADTCLRAAALIETLDLRSRSLQRNGGYARAAKLSPERRREIARHAAITRHRGKVAA